MVALISILVSAGITFIFIKDHLLCLGMYQKVEAIQLKIPLYSGFGYSLSKEKIDVDENGFVDFAVGAPFSNQSVAVVLKSKPVIDFQATLILNSSLSYIKLEDEGKEMTTTKIFKTLMHYTSEEMIK